MTQPTIEQMIERTVGQDLWSLVRSVMCQGISINDDYHHGKRFASYEEYSARIDEAARERAEGLLAVICTALTAQGLPEVPRCPKLTEKARQAFADHMQAAKVCGDDPHDALLASAMGTLLRFHDKYHAAIAAVAKDGAG